MARAAGGLLAAAVLACGALGGGRGEPVAAELISVLERIQAAKSAPGKEVGPLEALRVVARASDHGSAMFEQVEAILRLPAWEDRPGHDCFDLTQRKGQRVGALFQLYGEDIKVQEMNEKGIAKSVLKKGDILMAINFESIQGLSLMELGDRMAELKPPKVFRFCRAPPPPPQQQQQRQEGKQAQRPKQQLRTQPITGGRYVMSLPDRSNIGLRLDEDLSVAAIHPSSALSGQVEEGDKLVSVNGAPLAGKSLEEAVALIKRAAMPVALEFSTKRRDVPASAQQSTTSSPPPPPPPAAGHGQGFHGAEGALVLTSPPILSGSRYALKLAKFGDAPACTVLNLTVAERKRAPTGLDMGCDPAASMAALGVENAIVFMLRGKCTFVTKARLAEELGGKGMIVVTRDFEPLAAMPAGAGELVSGPVNLAAAMMPWSEGSALATLLSAGPLQGFMEGPNCGDTSALLERATESAADPVDYSTETLADGRQVKRFPVSNTAVFSVWSSETGETVATYGIAAGFGPTYDKFPTIGSTDPVVPKMAPEPFDACARFEGDAWRGALVVVRRGSCSYADKALNVQLSGAKAMVLINSEDGLPKLHSMMGPPEQAAAVKIPSAMVNATAGIALERMLQQPAEGAGNPKTLLISKLYRHTFYYCNRIKGTVCGVDAFPEMARTA